MIQDLFGDPRPAYQQAWSSTQKAVAISTPHLFEIAQEIALELGKKLKEVGADDVAFEIERRGFTLPLSRNWSGKVFSRQFTPVGTRQSRHPRANARLIRVWSLKA